MTAPGHELEAIAELHEEGVEITGWPTTVIRRGEVIVDGGELRAERGSEHRPPVHEHVGIDGDVLVDHEERGADRAAAAISGSKALARPRMAASASTLGVLARLRPVSKS